MKKVLNKFKKGVASFYIVAFSTLILLVVSVGFAAVIISEVTRTSNDDLSQSAYDSAMAGVEDAKLAFANYRKCIESGATVTSSLSSGNNVTCSDIIYWVEHPDCDQVAHILGRIGKFDSGEVLVSDTVMVSGNKVSSDLDQAYTCVQIDAELSDYKATLTSSRPDKVVKVKLDGVAASQLQYVRIKWFSNREGSVYNYSNFTGERVAFQPISAVRASTPPTLQVQLIQTSNSFHLSQFDEASEGVTDRATLYLVPTSNSEKASASYSTDKYFPQYEANGKTGRNWISKDKVAHTNQRDKKNFPYVVYCPNNSTSDYACSVDIELPAAVGGGRSNETFSFVVSLPYGEPDTDFSIEYYCADGAICSKQQVASGGTTTTQNSSKAIIKGTQVGVDSTGRANDLFRRVEVRLEPVDDSFNQPSYAVQLLSNSTSGSTIEKSLTVTKEWGL